MTRARSVRRLTADGDYIEAMKAAAVKLAAEIDDPEAPASSKAAIMRELRPLLDRLESLAPKTDSDRLDELAKRRRARNAG